MSLTERSLWRKIKRGVRAHGPAMTAAVERSFGLVRDALSVAEMAKLIEGTRSEAFASALLDDARLDRAFDPARARLIGSTQAAMNGFIRDLPGGLAATSGFNMLDEKVLEAVGRLDTRVMTSLRKDVRETARLAYRRGLEAGLAPAAIARGIRDTIGLAPNQLAAVDNFEKALREGRVRDALGYKLRDKRFDRTLARAAEKGLTSAQISSMTAAYKRRYIAHNAKTHAYTAINDSQRLGKHLATQAGIDSGALPADRMISRWAASGDGKERPTHAAANGEVVPFGEPFSTGDVIPGSSEWGCRCIKVDTVLADGEAMPSAATPRPVAGGGSVIGQPSTAYPSIKPGGETLDQYRRADGTWTPERQRLHNAIVDQHFAGGATPVANPVATIMGGGPASGKGRMLAQTRLPTNRVTIDSDEIKKMLPEFRERTAAGSMDAAAMAHEESSYLSKLIAERAAGGRFNFVMDGTGDGSYESLTRKVAGYRKGGARVSANYVTVDTEVAVARAQSRGVRSGRFVPENTIRDTHRRISEIIPRVLDEGHFDDFVLWDNNGAKAFKVATASGGRLEVFDPVAWERFLSKVP